MTATRDILNAGLAVQAGSLAFSNIKRKKKKKLIGMAMHNIVGTSLIQSQAQIIGGIN